MNCLTRRRSGGDFRCSIRSADDCAVYETKAGFLRPEAAVAAHLGLAAQHGAALHFEEPITDWAVTETGTVRVTTTKTVYEAEHLVIAPGAWAEPSSETARRFPCMCVDM